MRIAVVFTLHVALRTHFFCFFFRAHILVNLCVKNSEVHLQIGIFVKDRVYVVDDFLTNGSCTLRIIKVHVVHRLRGL